MRSWSVQWMALLDGLPLDEETKERRIRQGKAAAQSGRVQDLVIQPGRLHAKVQGGRPIPFLVNVDVPTLTSQDWAQIIGLLAEDVRLCARLLAGQEPDDLIQRCAQDGVSLLPSIDTVTFAAGHGPDDQAPTVGLAVWAAMGQQLRHDPFALFRVRGRGRERMLRDIAKARGQQGTADGVCVDSLDPLGWTRPITPIEQIQFPDALIPQRCAPALAALGDPPSWAGAMDALSLFGPIIEQGAQEAARLLFEQDADACNEGTREIS